MNKEELKSKIETMFLARTENCPEILNLAEEHANQRAIEELEIVKSRLNVLKANFPNGAIHAVMDEIGIDEAIANLKKGG